MKIIAAMAKLTLAATLTTGLLSCVPERVHEPAGKIQRFGSIIGLREDKQEEYKKLHAAVWPEVAKMIQKCNIRNYSIFLRRLEDGHQYLFSYFEYAGNDFKADMARMAADSITKQWWKVTDPCQKPLTDRKEGEWWASMEEVFHQD
jgi:L-rhamnose mutarotase